jgi:hypothetical protein
MRPRQGDARLRKKRMSEGLWAQRPTVDAGATLAVVWWAEPTSLDELPTLRSRLRAALDSGAAAGAEAVQWLLLAFEELASNGLRHGRSPVQVVVSDTGHGWLLDVTDTATDSPPRPAVGRDPATGGLGLYMVARLSAAHGWTIDGECKHVWVRIDHVTDSPAAPVRRLPKPRASSEEASHSD